jgi:hypothetical protein
MPTVKKRIRCAKCLSRRTYDKIVFLKVSYISGSTASFGFCKSCSDQLLILGYWLPNGCYARPLKIESVL